MKTIYAQLATVQAQKAVLEAQEKALKLEILTDMEEKGESTMTNEYGKFTVSHRTSYTYSEKVQELEEKVKVAKVKEVQKGIAKESITTYLTATLTK